MAAQFSQAVGKQVINRDPIGFEKFFVATRFAHQVAAIAKLQRGIANTRSLNLRKQLKGRLSAAGRMQCIFEPVNRKWNRLVQDMLDRQLRR